MNKEFKYQNKRIFYRISGIGNPVVLIHGFGEDGNIWNNQVEILKDKFRLIVPDLPGSGNSEMIDDMSMEGMADLVKAIIDQEASPAAGKRATLIGHSMGGYITLAFAEKYPGYLNSFGLFHSTAYADSEEKKASRQKGIEFTREHGVFAFLKATLPNLFSQQTREERPEMINELVRASNNFSAPAIVSYYEAMMKRPDRTHMLQKATVPVLFIMGKNDTIIPMEDVLAQSHLPGKSYIYIFLNSGHMGMLEEKEKCKEILEKFLLEIDETTTNI